MDTMELIEGAGDAHNTVDGACDMMDGACDTENTMDWKWGNRGSFKKIEQKYDPYTQNNEEKELRKSNTQRISNEDEDSQTSCKLPNKLL